jgi:hypothetical protein
MRSAFAVVFLAGLALLAVAGLTRGSDLVYSPGVSAQLPVTELPAGARACQGPMRAPDTFDRVGLTVGTAGSAGPALDVEVVDERGRELAAGSLAAGYAGATEQVVEVGEVRTADPVSVCIVPDRKVAVLGQVGAASQQTTGTIDGADVGVDFAFTLRSEERSLVALAPAVAERASLFRAGWLPPAAYLVLALAVIVAAPLLLARGFARAAAADRGASAAERDARSAATTAAPARTSAEAR